MVKSKNIIAGLGVVAGLGMALLPLGAFAADEQTNSQVIRARVAEEFILTVTPSTTIAADKAVADALSVPKGGINETLTHDVEVKGNLYKGYDLTVAAVDTTDLRFVKDATKDFWSADRYNDSVKIPTGTGVAEGTSAWGYKKSETANSFTGDYIALTTNDANLKTNANPMASFDDHVYLQYGISVADTQAAGVYEGKVIYKATPKI